MLQLDQKRIQIATYTWAEKCWNKFTNTCKTGLFLRVERDCIYDG